MIRTRNVLIALLSLLAARPALQAGATSAAAREVAEAVISRFGARAARKGLPQLAARIEALAARHGPEALTAVRKVGPRAFELAERAGVHGSKAVRVLAVHGEAGAACVLARPAAMRQFLRFGEQGAAVLCKHPGVAEAVLEKGGGAALRAMSAVGPRNGRRVAMLLEGEVGKLGGSERLLEAIAKYGDRGAKFVWENKKTLAGAAALTAFLSAPEKYLDGTSRLVGAAGEAVVKPAAGIVSNVLYWLAGLAALLVAGAGALIYKFGPPGPESIKAALGALRRS